jgi:hypothetical protein
VISASANIVQFDVTSSYPYLGIDDLSFGTPTPPGCAHVSTRLQLIDALKAGYSCVFVNNYTRIDLAQVGDNQPGAPDSVIHIPDGVTLESGRSPTVPGALLYMSRRLQNQTPMLDMGANAHITGLRLRGYDQLDTTKRNDTTVGIRVNDVGGVLIDNNEIYGWPEAGVGVGPVPNRESTAASVHITENYIHNNVQCSAGYEATYPTSSRTRQLWVPASP